MLLFERGRIRTYVEFSTDLQSAAFNHSATLPAGLYSTLLVKNLGFILSCQVWLGIIHRPEFCVGQNTGASDKFAIINNWIPVCVLSLCSKRCTEKRHKIMLHIEAVVLMHDLESSKRKKGVEPSAFALARQRSATELLTL